jgi:hypothetical protein
MRARSVCPIADVHDPRESFVGHELRRVRAVRVDIPMIRRQLSPDRLPNGYLACFSIRARLNTMCALNPLPFLSSSYGYFFAYYVRFTTEGRPRL